MSMIVEEMQEVADEIAWNGDAPWSTIGKPVRPGTKANVYLKESGLDWTVDKVQYTYPHNNKIHQSSRVALVKGSDSFELTTISGNWEPVQNKPAFEFLDDFCALGGMTIEIVGDINNGRKVFALARINEHIDIFGGDIIDSYFLFTIPHEYGYSTDLRFTPIRRACLNTTVLSLDEKIDSLKVNHRKKFDPSQAQKILGIASNRLHTYEKNAIYLGSKKAAHEDVIEYFKTIFPSVSTKITDDTISRPAKTAIKILETQPGAKFAHGSWWQALNAVTFIIDHILGKSVESRMNSAWYGQNRIKKLNALNLALEKAENSEDL